MVLTWYLLIATLVACWAIYQVLIPAFEIAALSEDELFGAKWVIFISTFIVFVLLAPFVLYIMISKERVDEYVILTYEQITDMSDE